MCIFTLHQCKCGWWIWTTSLTSHNQFQLCYPHIHKGENANFTLVFDCKEHGGSGFCDSPMIFLGGEHQNMLPPCSLLSRAYGEQNMNIDLPCTHIHFKFHSITLVATKAHMIIRSFVVTTLPMSRVIRGTRLTQWTV